MEIRKLIFPIHYKKIYKFIDSEDQKQIAQLQKEIGKIGETQSPK